MMGFDLEDGEIEDGEIPEDNAECYFADKGSVVKTAVKHDEKQKEVEVKIPASGTKLKRTISDSIQQRVENSKTNDIKGSRIGNVEKTNKTNQGGVAYPKTDLNKLSNDKETTNVTEESAHDNDDKQTRRKKRKRKHRDEDSKRKDSKRSKRSHGTLKGGSENEALEMGLLLGSDHDNYDDDEMLNVRGASPLNLMGYSPSGHSFNDELYGYEDDLFEESLGSEESEFGHENYMTSRHASGDGSKTGNREKRRSFIREGSRGRTIKRPLINRKDSVATKRLGPLRQQRTSMTQDSRQGPDSVCMFFMQGRCQKGNQCPYSHDALPPRKLELCKFYLMDCCAKKDKCLYMHSDFPCKFFHTGMKCFAGDRCKYSHGPLTEQTRIILVKHLETAPKEILGDFPRLSREGAAAMVYKKTRGTKGNGASNKKIPSLFEIEVPVPSQLLSSMSGDEENSPIRRSTPMPESDNEDGNRTPMPSSPKPDNHKSSIKSSVRKRSTDDGAKPEDSGKENKRHSRLSKSSRRRSDSNLEHSEEQEETRKLSPPKRTGSDECAAGGSLYSGGEEAMEITDDDGKMDTEDVHCEEFKRIKNLGAQTPPHTFTNVQDNNNSSCSTEMGGIPLNLPKKQRELFLRIKQQQRESAASCSQDHNLKNGAETMEKDPQQEENWYSKEPPKMRTPSPPPPPIIGPTAISSIKLSEIDISESVSKLLSSIRYQQSLKSNGMQPTEETKEQRTPVQTQAPVTPPATQARDPRLISRDPRNRSTNSSSASILSPNSYETHRPDPRTSKRSSSSEDMPETPRTSIYSSLTVPMTNVLPAYSADGSDTDLRRLVPSQSHIGFEGASDVDLRSNVQPSATSSAYAFGDTDLRGDVDLRGMLGLPFKPVPMHTPATEIAASLTSHPPFHYKVRSDPRLRKLFKVNNENPASPSAAQLPPATPKRSQSHVSRSDPRRRSASAIPVTSSPQASVPQMQELPQIYTAPMPQNNMNMMHEAHVPAMMPMMPAMSMMPTMPNMPPVPNALPFDQQLPRNPRNAPGLLGPAPMPMNYRPNAPMYEELEEGSSNGSDTDLRMFYNSGPMNMQPPQAQNMHTLRNRAWHGARNYQQYQPHQMDQQGSFTPPS
ncbi:hypothetical protein C0J52_00788 [Blattella germanica]|nr:hypothetical protein C0J52_00788 [Blattella germanica]